METLLTIQADDLVLPEFQICGINVTTSTNIRCLSGNTYSFRLCIMPIWSYRFCIPACTSSHHLQIYLWVEKLYCHAVAHNFTKFPLKSCSLSLTFIITIEVQKQLCTLLQLQHTKRTEVCKGKDWKLLPSLHICYSKVTPLFYFLLSTHTKGEKLCLIHSLCLDNPCFLSMNKVYHFPYDSTLPVLLYKQNQEIFNWSSQEKTKQFQF